MRAKVTMAGVTIGKVTAIDLDRDNFTYMLQSKNKQTCDVLSVTPKYTLQKNRQALQTKKLCSCIPSNKD